jgi:predicted RNA-binding protein associated with RNAse of E/G family
MFHPVGAGYSVWWFFGADHEFRNWYVNLERPATRWSDGTLAGVDTVDHDLDIIVAPDGHWELTDEDIFTEFLR